MCLGFKMEYGLNTKNNNNINALVQYSFSLNEEELLDAVLNNQNKKSYTCLLIMQMLKKTQISACEILGNFYKDGDIVYKNEETAVSLIKVAANQGSPIANYSLGWFFHEKKDYMIAIDYFNKCIELNNVLDEDYLGDVYSCLGDCYLNITEPKLSEAFNCLLTAADKYHDAYACRRIAIEFLDSNKEYYSPEKGIKYLKQSVELKDIIGAILLADYYITGNKKLNIDKNLKIAQDILLPYVNEDDIDVLMSLGDIHLFGEETSQFVPGKSKACFYYEKAWKIEKRDQIASKLGLAYYMCNNYLVSQEMLIIADAGGITDYSDFLGRMYKDGKLQEINEEKALYYYGRTYDQGTLNNMYTYMEYVELLVKCGRYYKAYNVADKGFTTFNDVCFLFVKADLVLNKKYKGQMKPEDAERDLEICIKYNYKVKESHNILADYYMRIGNYRGAEKHYMDAFNNGLADAAVYLARLYEKGGGSIQSNTNLAYEWFKKAADAGSYLGKQELECWKPGLLGLRFKRYRSL